jgi:ubiquitin C-terminal hydrolase
MSILSSAQLGLANLGNTCFLNVILQALRNTPQMATIFLTDGDAKLRDGSKKHGIVSAFQTLMRDFWNHPAPEGSSKTLVPRGFMHSLHTVLREMDDDWYHPGEQADAAEALQYILDSLHDGTCRRVKMDVVGDAASGIERSYIKAINSWAGFFAKEYSSIVQSFYGQNAMMITCDLCGNTSERYEPWTMIKAPIPGADTVGAPVPTLDDCLRAAHTSETIEDYSCDVCKKKTTATMKNSISHLPPVTIVSVKRFTNAGRKVRGKIAWDLDCVDFAPHMAFPHDPLSGGVPDTVYETIAVIQHHGSLHGGHYTMHAKHDTEWYEYDDGSVHKSHPGAVVTADSYIAFMVPRSRRPALNEGFGSAVERYRAAHQAPPQ